MVDQLHDLRQVIHTPKASIYRSSLKNDIISEKTGNELRESNLVKSLEALKSLDARKSSNDETAESEIISVCVFPSSK